MTEWIEGQDGVWYAAPEPTGFEGRDMLARLLPDDDVLPPF